MAVDHDMDVVDSRLLGDAVDDRDSGTGVE
jgi:hypothetical protein